MQDIGFGSLVTNLTTGTQQFRVPTPNSMGGDNFTSSSSLLQLFLVFSTVSPTYSLSGRSCSNDFGKTSKMHELFNCMTVSEASAKGNKNKRFISCLV